MDKQDEELFNGLRHFSTYMHEIATSPGSHGAVHVACTVVSHIADGVLFAALALQEEAKEAAKK